MSCSCSVLGEDADENSTYVLTEKGKRKVHKWKKIHFVSKEITINVGVFLH